jgi:hypothetical protein
MTMRQEAWKFERRTDRLAPLGLYIKRIVGSVAIAIGLMLVALAVGIAGYHLIAGFDFVDSLLEASMILGGMGPVRELPNQSAKIFASIYAMFSGVFFIAMMGIILAPVAHRVLHKFHLDEGDVE